MRKALQRLRRHLRGLRGASQADSTDAPLREFVYLDQVSVYSLIASRVGAVAAEVTDTETSSLSQELQSSAGVSAGVVRTELGASSQSSRSAASQVLRKSVIQSTFKDLVEIEQESMALRAPAQDAHPPQLRDADELAQVLATQGPQAWIVDPHQLRRGQLFELETTLEADAILRVSTIMSTVLEIVTENPVLGGFDDPFELERARTAQRLLQALLVGLVPLRATVVDYGHVTTADHELIVHRALLTQLPPQPGLTVHPLQVVGVAEEGSFWRDRRRVLFSQARYRVLGRLGRDGVQQSWSPVKLVDVLKEILPTMASDIDLAGEGFLAAMAQGAAAAERNDERQLTERMRVALISYAAMLAAEHGKNYSAQELEQHGLPSAEQCASYAGVEAQRAAFAPITEHLLRELQIPSQRLVSAQLRERALREAGIGVSGEVLPGTEQGSPSDPLRPDTASPTQPSDAEPSPGYLDAEIVAIYW